MMSCKAFWSKVVVLFVAAYLLVGCTTEVDYTLGSEFLPTNQNMELRRRVYRDGQMIEGSTTANVPMSKAYLYQNDSIKSSNLDLVYFGAEHSDVYGTRRAAFMSQVLFGSKLDEEYGWGYRPIFDSMTLSLYVTDYHGDTTKKQSFAVYEITSNEYIDGHKDSIFYTNFNPEDYIAKEPIFTFTFPDQERGAYVGNMESPKYCNVYLERTDATMEYIQRLMFTTKEELEANDGYGLDKEEIYEQGNEGEFVKQIRGIYIAPIGDVEGEGAMFATDVENTALVLYARSRYKEDPEIIKDTVIMSYNFYVNPLQYDVKAGNVSISCVEHEFIPEDATTIKEHKEVLVGKVDAMAGVVTELEFTDEFLQSMADIALSEPNAVVSVNQAQLNIYLEGSDYDYLNLNLGTLIPVMDAAMPRMGLYARYGGYEDAYTNDIIAIADYLYTKESSNYSIPYDGYLNRSLGCYRMDISNFIQSMIMAAATNVKEDGTVDFEKFRTDATLGRSRRLYIGPAADALFGFQRQQIAGGDVPLASGEKNKAPVTLEITYTVVY